MGLMVMGGEYKYLLNLVPVRTRQVQNQIGGWHPPNHQVEFGGWHTPGTEPNWRMASAKPSMALS